MNDELEFSIDVTQDDPDDIEFDPTVSYLSAEALESMPKWQYLTIASFAEVEPKNIERKSYYKIIFVNQDTTYKVKQAYFHKAFLKPLLTAFKIEVLARKSQVVGKQLWCKLGTRVHNDKTYVDVKEYSATPPETNVGASMQPQEEVPF